VKPTKERPEARKEDPGSQEWKDAVAANRVMILMRLNCPGCTYALRLGPQAKHKEQHA
jgi:hypothetical protein